VLRTGISTTPVVDVVFRIGGSGRRQNGNPAEDLDGPRWGGGGPPGGGVSRDASIFELDVFAPPGGALFWP